MQWLIVLVLSTQVKTHPHTCTKSLEEYVCANEWTNLYSVANSRDQDAFSSSMPLADISKLAKCTTCHFDQDFSNYWTANLYFRARNGSYKRVPQMANQFNDGDNAGITPYYTSAGPNLTTAFKPGFRMLAGNSTRRTSEGLGKSMQQCYRCFSKPNFGGSMYPRCMDPQWDTDFLPKQPCPGGIRSNIIFPQYLLLLQPLLVVWPRD
jgi:hypothetical protein